MEIERLITQEEMAQALHCHINQITMLREVGVLPAIKTGKNYMFSRKTYEDFITLYAGMDVSNRVRAIQAKNNVLNKMAQI